MRWPLHHIVASNGRPTVQRYRFGCRGRRTVFDHLIDGEGTIASIADDIMQSVEDLRRSLCETSRPKARVAFAATPL
jgi:hypothetical protein